MVTVFRDSSGGFVGGFGTPLGHNTAFFAEVMAVILVIDNAFDRGWFKFWSESDSMLAVQLLLKPSLHPHRSIRNR